MSWHQERDLLQSLQALQRLCRGEAVVLGNSGLYQQLRQRLAELLGPAAPNFAGHDSRSCELPPNFHYIIAGSPADAIADTLLQRGVAQENVTHADRLIAIDPDAADAAPETQDYWLECSRCDDLSKLHPVFNYVLSNHQTERVFHWLDRILALSDSPPAALGELVLRIAQRPEFLQRPETFQPLAQRAAAQLAVRTLPQEPKPILLYPSGGRCGGNSIHYALETAEPAPLKGGHEAKHIECYALLRLALARPDAAPLCQIALLHLLTENDGLGGNPACFLLPHALALPGFRFTLLHVRRDRNDQIASILQRNFHYSENDTVPNRVTALDYGEGSSEQWNALSRRQKVEWYLDKVERSIQSVRPALAYFEVPLHDLDAQLNPILKAAGFSAQARIGHLNAPPAYRSFSPQELAFLYRHFQSKELHRLPKDDIEAALRRAGLPPASPK